MIVILGFALLLGVGGGLLYFKGLTSTKVVKKYELEKLPCNLLETPCKVSFDGSEVMFDINPRPISIMNESIITISNLSREIDDPKIRIYGLNMDMGVIITSLQKLDSTLQASVALSACLVEDVMRYRISVYNGNEELKLYADFDLER